MFTKYRFQAVASDIDKEEEALRAGMVERCELTLQSRLGKVFKFSKKILVTSILIKKFVTKF